MPSSIVMMMMVVAVVPMAQVVPMVVATEMESRLVGERTEFSSPGEFVAGYGVGQRR
jgi:hypothetical protein